MKDALEAVKGTFLEEVFNIMLKGDFTEVATSAPQKGEVELRDMTPFEKALKSYLSKCGPKEKDLVDSLNGMPASQRNSDAFKAKAVELAALRENFKLADDMLWNSIKVLSSLWEGGIGTRTGYKVVKFPTDDECDCPACQLSNFLKGKSGGSISVISIN